MLVGFLVRDEEDFEDWRRRIVALEGKGFVHIYERERERAGAVDEVESWDETGEEDGEQNDEG